MIALIGRGILLRVHRCDPHYQDSRRLGVYTYVTETLTLIDMSKTFAHDGGRNGKVLRRAGGCRPASSVGTASYVIRLIIVHPMGGPQREAARDRVPRFLLVGPWDPACGEYTFLAPPLGVWRLAGVLENAGVPTEVFDPNCLAGPPEAALESLLRDGRFDVVGFSTTGMTLKFDLTLAHLVRRVLPQAFLLAGGMEATFQPEALLDLGPFDLIVLGEGEKPLLELAQRLGNGGAPSGIPGTAYRLESGRLARHPQTALNAVELRDAIALTPYERMPVRSYWRRLENAYAVGSLPYKAQREAQLAEIRSIRLITLNYCPLGCTFCSSTNFLNAAQDGTARIARLDAGDVLAMLRRIVSAYPDVRTVIFQDDIFVFTADSRLEPLCDGIVAAKAEGTLPPDLQFISTNRIDAVTESRLLMMRRAGFRVLGFGVESFSRAVLEEFHKGRIYPYVEPTLSAALAAGITPFLDMILTSPRSRLFDLAQTIGAVHRWVQAGCEVGAYPYVIPFSGSAMAGDPSLAAFTLWEDCAVSGTSIRWRRPAKILPLDPETRATILAIEQDFLELLPRLAAEGMHLPSRVRSLLWVVCAVPQLSRRGFAMPSMAAVVHDLMSRLSHPSGLFRSDLQRSLLQLSEHAA